MNQSQFIADQIEERVDAFLGRVAPEYSRSFWQKLCEDQQVSVNDTPAKPNRKLQPGDKINVIVPEPPDFVDQQLPIIYEDDDVIVINKPTGVLTHAKGALSEEFTIADFVRPRTTDGVHTNRPGIVHRLDRGTSGVIIAAKNTPAQHWLQKQFSLRKVKKTYLALVDGHLKQPRAVLQLPIERNPKKPQTFRVSANGKTAETMYETERTFAEYTLLRLHPLTGRTHQLRVHLQHLGHPIVGDELYGSSHKKLGRLFLHAASLELTLPSKERKVFTAPLPKELAEYIKTLQ